MNQGGLVDRVLKLIDIAWMLWDDFKPDTTITEVAEMLNEQRARRFDADADRVHSTLRAQLTAAESLHEKVSATAVPGESPEVDAQVAALGRRIGVLRDLLSYDADRRDVLAGSLTGGQRSDGIFARAATLPRPGSAPRRAGRALADRLLADRERRQYTSGVVAQLIARRTVYEELRGRMAAAIQGMSAEGQSEIGAMLSAVESEIETARSALDDIDRPTRQGPRNPHERAENATGSMEHDGGDIDIE